MCCSCLARRCTCIGLETVNMIKCTFSALNYFLWPTGYYKKTLHSTCTLYICIEIIFLTSACPFDTRSYFLTTQSCLPTPHLKNITYISLTGTLHQVRPTNSWYRIRRCCLTHSRRSMKSKHNSINILCSVLAKCSLKVPLIAIVIAWSPKARHHTWCQTFTLWCHNQMARQIVAQLWCHNRMTSECHMERHMFWS